MTLKSSFLQGFLDADLEHGLSSSVPPGELSCIGILRRAHDYAKFSDPLENLLEFILKGECFPKFVTSIYLLVIFV